MGFLDTNNKRKSAALTSVIMGLLLVALFFFGLKYLDPPEEYGIAVNFGTSDVGQGNIQPKAPLKSASEPVEEVEEEIQEEVQKVVEQVEETVVEETSTAAEEVLTQETEEAIAIKKAEEERKKQEAEAKRIEEERIEKERLEAEQKERERQAAIAKKQAEEDAKRKRIDDMMGGINDASGTEEDGEGNDNQAGDKGKITGDPNASGYYGNGGSGGDGGYNLGNRKPVNRPKPDYICKETGRVVIKIEVDRLGKVLKASLELKGTTNTNKCLVDQAIEAAYKTKWSQDSKAQIKQIGSIVYTFEQN